MSEKDKLRESIKLAVDNTVKDIIADAPPQPENNEIQKNTTSDDVYGKFLRRCIYRDDINTEWWDGYKKCFMYDFNDIPTVTFPANEDYGDSEVTYALEGEFIANFLVRFIENMGGPKHHYMCHAQSLGFKQDVFVVFDEKVDNYSVFFNCNIINVSEETEVSPERCINYPELILDIERPKWIELVCQNYDGEIRRERWHGKEARYIMQGAGISMGVPFWREAEEFAIVKGIKHRNLVFDNLTFSESDLV